MKYTYQLYKLSLFSLILILPCSLKGQNQNSFKYYDSLSYNQYLSNDWTTLIETGKEALNYGIDYHYLRLRLGIAYFSKGNYLIAEKHFEKALKMNILDPLSREYLYYAKLNTGMVNEANAFYKENIHYLNPKINCKPRFFESLTLDFLNQYNTENNNSLTETNLADISQNGYQIINNKFLFGSFLLTHNLTYNLSLTHGGSFLRKNNLFYYNDSTGLYKDPDQELNQNQYYISLKLQSEKKLTISASVHLLNYHSGNYSFSRVSGIGNGFTSNGNDNTEYLYRLALSKRTGRINLIAGFSYSNLNNSTQFQQDLQAVYYPLGNLNLYSLSEIIHSENKNNKNNQHNWVYSQLIGFKVIDKLWVETSLLSGNLWNMNMNNGFVIYNGSETLNSKIAVSLIIPGKYLDLRLSGSLQNYTSSYYSSQQYQTDLNNICYKNGSLLLETTIHF